MERLGISALELSLGYHAEGHGEGEHLGTSQRPPLFGWGRSPFFNLPQYAKLQSYQQEIFPYIEKVLLFIEPIPSVKIGLPCPTNPLLPWQHHPRYRRDLPTPLRWANRIAAWLLDNKDRG